MNKLTRQQKRALKRKQQVNPAENPIGGVAAMGVTFRSGPLPDPKELAEYEAVVPGSANLIVQKFALQTDHRRELEGVVVKGNNMRANRAQWMSFVLGLAAIVGGVYLIATGKSTAGLTAIITSVTGLVAVFITGKVFQERERREKRAGR